jgi:hypothetical protein
MTPMNISKSEIACERSKCNENQDEFKGWLPQGWRRTMKTKTNVKAGEVRDSHDRYAN